MSDCSYSFNYYFLNNLADNDNGLTEFVYTIYRMAIMLFFTDTEQCMSVAPAGPAVSQHKHNPAAVKLPCALWTVHCRMMSDDV